MLALYRCGRQAEALDLYRATRAFLVEELGIEPGRGLQELEQAVLNQAPALEVAGGQSWRSILVAPLHHHFEALGWPAYKVTMRYWIIAVVLAALGMILALIG